MGNFSQAEMKIEIEPTQMFSNTKHIKCIKLRNKQKHKKIKVKGSSHSLTHTYSRLKWDQNT